MEMNNMQPSNPTNGINTSTHTVFGVKRRAIAFGFFLFLMLVVLAVVYSQFVSKEVMAPMTTNDMTMSTERVVPTDMMMPSEKAMPVVGPATPDTVTNDLIDEALADREDTDTYTEDEVADVQDGSNY